MVNLLRVLLRSEILWRDGFIRRWINLTLQLVESSTSVSVDELEELGMLLLAHGLFEEGSRMVKRTVEDNGVGTFVFAYSLMSIGKD